MAENKTFYKITFYIGNSPFARALICDTLEEAKRKRILLAHNANYHDITIKRIKMPS